MRIKSGTSLKLVVDGTEIPYSDELAKAAILYHMDRGDAVSKPDTENRVRICTKEDTSVTLTEEFARAVAGRPMDEWEGASVQALGRKFDPSLDLYCYNKDKRVSAEVCSKSRARMAYWERVSSQTYLYSDEKLCLYHIGDCRDSGDRIHRHDLEISVEVKIWKTFGAAITWDSDLLRGMIKEMDSRILASKYTGNDEKERQVTEGMEDTFLWIEKGKKWHQFLSGIIADRMMKTRNDLGTVSVSVMEGKSLLAYSEIMSGDIYGI